MSSLETIIIQNLVFNEKFGRKVIAFLKFEYFQGEHNVCFRAIYEYFKKYNQRPTKDALSVSIAEMTVDDGLKQKSIILLEDIFKPIDEHQSIDWLFDETERWCKERAMTLAILKSVDVLKDPKKNKGVIRDLVSKALAVSFDTSVGHDYFKNTKERMDYYTGKSSDLVKIPFRLEKFNQSTNNGIETKSLNIILGGTGGGKSLVMCSLAADYLRDGHNVLYITLELADMKVAQRVDANLLGVEIEELKTFSYKSFDNAVSSVETNTGGRFFVKEYPNSSANADHFRVLLDELKEKQNFVPLVVFIDYLNICSSTRYKPNDPYQYVKGISEEIRALAQEKNMAIWSATQTNRDGFNKSDVDIDNTSESFGLPMTADYMISIYADEQMEKMNKLLVNQATKNRYADKSKLPNWFVGCNRSKMTLYNLEESIRR